MKQAILLAAMMAAWGCGQKPQGPSPTKEAAPQRVEQVSPEKAKKAAPAQPGEVAVISPIAITVTGMEVGPVAVRGISGSGPSKKSYLMVRLKIMNRSTDKKLEFRGWDDHCTLKDDKGNLYKRESPGFGEAIIGVAARESLYPGKTITELLVFEVPVKSAKTLSLELEGERIGVDGAFRFEHPITDIRGR